MNKVLIKFTSFYLFAGLASFFIMGMMYMYLYPEVVVGDPMMSVIFYTPVVIVFMIVATAFCISLKNIYKGWHKVFWPSILALVIGIIVPLLIPNYTLKSEIFLGWFLVVYALMLGFIILKKKA
ncbi:hypothetical protein [Listeria grayi]|uniref:hypothetical protein n=1 Tax=Listeria grayi TaxID=1641 RepID=UPI001628742F|nr:hypothetical protein [Listeria grayi]MBC1923015.1 hypothetical protein [Listeria grayi]